MGKGDRKTRRGKINRSSYGNSRPHPSPQAEANKSESGKSKTPRKTPARKKAS